jgi:hypothetical protein
MAISITNTLWLVKFMEILAVHCQKHTKHINMLCGSNAKFLNVKAGDFIEDTSVVQGFICVELYDLKFS